MAAVSNAHMRAARVSLLASLGVLAPALVFAQESARVVSLLRSNTPIGVAWGAFEAATFQITEAVPAMIAALESLPRGTQHERDYAAAALLDALIQIRPVPGVPPGPPAPASVVAPYLDRWPIQTLVLLGRSGPEGDPIVVNLFESLPRKRNDSSLSPGEMWFALANLLAHRSPPGFAATLLEGIELELVVTVSDNGDDGIDSVLGGGISGTDGVAQKPPGFPPHAVYRWDSQRVGSSILSTGIRTLYYTRDVSALMQFPVSYPSGPAPTVNDRFAYLSAILGGTYHPTLEARMWHSVKWSNGVTYRTNVADKQRAIKREYDNLIKRLVSDGHLSADEAAALPLQLTTTVKDERRDRKRPLPDVSRD